MVVFELEGKADAASATTPRLEKDELVMARQVVHDHHIKELHALLGVD